MAKCPVKRHFMTTVRCSWDQLNAQALFQSALQGQLGPNRIAFLLALDPKTSGVRYKNCLVLWGNAILIVEQDHDTVNNSKVR
jgi:hypothetical protein